MSYVNRIWGYLTGTGIIEPIDDIRAGNPPTNPELLDWLTMSLSNLVSMFASSSPPFARVASTSFPSVPTSGTKTIQLITHMPRHGAFLLKCSLTASTALLVLSPAFPE